MVLKFVIQTDETKCFLWCPTAVAFPVPGLRPLFATLYRGINCFHFQAKEELELAKKNYEALNTQLLEEIPGFTQQCMALVVDCLKNFALSQNRLYYDIQQEYEQLLQVRNKQRFFYHSKLIKG